ncbi:MAG: glycerol-3-phosphate dehydrogenase/oxidase [Myxococcota bacterium]
MNTWTLQDRNAELDSCCQSGVEVLIIGGGITGAGILRECAQRGLRALLVERDDFASGTSSASSKLVHGGLRYLEHLNVRLTRDSSRERSLLLKHNPHLIERMPFLIVEDRPSWKLRAGLRLYRTLSGERDTGMLSAREWQEHLPLITQSRVGAVGQTMEAQIHDARLVLETLKDARRLGGRAVSRCEVRGFLRNEGRISGARLFDRHRNQTQELRASMVVNATGVAIDRLRRHDVVGPATVRSAKGTHLVLPRRALPLNFAVAFPAADRRRLFAYPVQDALLLGTTDTFVDESTPLHPTSEERDYLLAGLRRFFPGVGEDVWSAWSGVRPLVDPRGANASASSRDHRIMEDPSGLLSVAGGKLTTFRLMGEEVVDRILRRMVSARRVQLRPSATAGRPLREDSFDYWELILSLEREFGCAPVDAARLVRTWGEDAYRLLEHQSPNRPQRLGNTPYYLAELRWTAQHELATTLNDVFERRLPIAAFSPQGGEHVVRSAAAAIGEVLGWDATEQSRQAERCRARIRSHYRVHTAPGGSSARRGALRGR